MWNEAQQKYIDTIDGRVMVNAVAGSGKSSSTVARIKNMVDKGISPKDILAISFTKVASENLTEKLNKVGVKGVTSCTIHALAYRIVERKITKEVLKKKMMQPWAKESCIFEAYKSYTGKYDKKDFKFESISNLISIQQGFMVSPNSEEEDMILPIDLDEEFDLSDVKYYYDFYSDYKKSKGLYDFNDLIFEALGIVDNTSRGRGSRSFKYKYALIDEAQDITDLQYALVEKVTPTGNISLVGDVSQCLLPDTKIKTSKGYKEIKDLTLDDKLIVASGFGEVEEKPIDSIPYKSYDGNIVKITTESGNVLKCTPKHMIFTDKVIRNKYVVYMTYREGYGFRIGQSCNYKADKNGKIRLVNGFERRMNCEKGTRAWCLFASEDKKEVNYKEMFLAFKYGIPLYPFEADCRMNMVLSNEEVKKLFNEVDSYSRGMKLLKDFGLEFDYPMAIGTFDNRGKLDKRKRYRLSFTMFADKKRRKEKNNKAFLYCMTTNEEFKKDLEKIVGREVPWHKNSAGNGGFEYKSVNQDADQLYSIATEIMKMPYDIIFTQYAKLTKTQFKSRDKMELIPACNLKEGMTVAVYDKNKEEIVESKIVKIEREYYKGVVYDINIKNNRNYIAEDIVVHNCLYNFSGANSDILKEYDTKYENVTVINMNTNYRSLPNIIEHGNILTKYYYGKGRNYVPAIPNREGEGYVLFDYYETAVEESMCTFKYIKRDIENGVPLSDIAVLYRNNNMSQYLEALLRSENIPYKLSGGSSLFDNDEIKSLGAFLKVIATDFDDSSVLYDLVAMRTIGGFRITNASLNKINWYARENKCSFFMALNECDYNGRGMVLETLNKLYDIRDRFSKDSVVIRMAKSFISKFGFDKRIQELPEEEREPRVMALNLVLDSIGKMDLNNAISFISGKGKAIKEDEENDKEKITLSTVHSAKGLQWKRTYVIRFDALPSLDIYSGVNLAYVSISRAQDYLRVSAIKRNEFMDVLMGMAPEYNYDEDMYDLDKEMEDIFNKIIG